MNLKEAFAQELPKWPQLYITGPDVSVEQAKAIMFRSETFLSSLGSRGGNNRAWNKWAVREFGLAKVSSDIDGGDHRWPTEDPVQKALLKLGYAIRDKWSREKALRAEYVEIARASCSFIGGPHGWCSPDGKIYFDDNVGKWPSVEDVHADLSAIATAFPFVKMVATLFDGESLDENRKPVVTFQVAEGVVGVADYERGDGAQMSLHHIQEDTSAAASQARLKQMVAGLQNPGREQGLPNEWIIEFAAEVRAWLPGAVTEILKEWESDDVNQVRTIALGMVNGPVPTGKLSRADDLRREVADVIQGSGAS